MKANMFVREIMKTTIPLRIITDLYEKMYLFLLEWLEKEPRKVERQASLQLHQFHQEQRSPKRWTVRVRFARRMMTLSMMQDQWQCH